jgi:gliding motility-associatede transport system auxiliary component
MAALMGRRAEILLTAVGAIGVLIALAYLAARFPLRFDLTEAKLYSLSPQSITMLQRVDKPVHIAFFHDPIMRETVELYELVARQNKLISVELHDPMLNPAQARLLGVQFAGTALLTSEGRKLQLHAHSETDIVNGILRISQGLMQVVCFLEGHGEANPFSTESHDHLEGVAGHSHGLGPQYVLHEEHGIAKARHSLEAMNYSVQKVSLLQSGAVPEHCSLLVLAGPKVALLAPELAALRRFLASGGPALFMLDPFVRTGLQPLLREYGVVLDDRMVIDESSHFWADPSAPAVTSYNHHLITRELPLTFFPGAQSLSPTPERVPGTTVIPLANSSKNSWAQANHSRIEFKKGRDIPGPNTLAVMATRQPVTPDSPAATRFGREGDDAREAISAVSRIVVIGDSDFATNSFFHIMGNGRLFLNAVNYLAARENLIGIEPRTRELPRVNLTNRQVRVTFFLSVILIPGLLAFIGVVVWWRQR